MGNELEDFVDYNPGNRGARSKFFKLKDKDKNEEGLHVGRVWLPKYPKPGYRHSFPRRLVVDDRQGKEGDKLTKFWGRAWASHEPRHFFDGDEKNKIKAAKLDNKTGIYDRDPQVCPMTRMLQFVAKQHDAGKLRIGETVFHFKGEDVLVEDEVKLTVGGLLGIVPRGKDIPADMLKALRKDGVKVADLWKEKAMAKLEWLLLLVDEEEPDLGLQVTTIPSLLGQEIQRETRKMMKAHGAEGGNFILNPYPFELSYNPKEGVSFKDMYAADAFYGADIPEAVAELLQTDPPENYDRDFQPGNVSQLRDLFETYATVDLDLDWIFKGVGDIPDDEPEEKAPARESKVASKPKEEPKPATSGRRQMKTETPKEPDPPEGTEPCERCKAPMLPTESVCKGCGAQYELDDESSEGGVPF